MAPERDGRWALDTSGAPKTPPPSRGSCTASFSMEACMLFSRKLRRELSACTSDEVLLPLHRPRVRGKCSSLVTCLRSETHGCRDVHSPAGFRDFYLQYKADYVLGGNPMKLSYLVGYQSSYPERMHHRGASIPADVDTGCDGQECG